MKLKRKPIEDEVWRNVSGAEPMPDWVSKIAEPGSKAGYTFRIESPEYGWRLVPMGYYIIQGPSDTYPCSPQGLLASYELEAIPAHVPSFADVPDVQLGKVAPTEENPS